MKFETITGAAYWASYFINGDASGITDEECALADAWCEQNNVRNVVDVAREDNGEACEAWFSWSYGFHTGADCAGGDLIDYVCEVREAVTA